MLHSLLLALLFYAVFSLFATIGLPLTRRFIDHPLLAYAAAKPTGLILGGYGVWLLSYFHILDYQNYLAVLATLAGTLIICLWTYFKSPVRTWQKSELLHILLTEAITLAVYIAYLFLRAHNARIEGTERFMDLAMLSASSKTHYFPFDDPWWAGKIVNYYYYGYYLISLLSNLSKIPYVLSYNFALGLIYAYSVLLSFALTYAIAASKKAGVLAAFMVTTAGMLYFAACTIRNFFSGDHDVYNYAASTRLITPSYTIREIPSYSFTVGDLHPHVIALPFFLLGLILIRAFVSTEKPSSGMRSLLAFAFATSGMINSWDMITLTALTGMALLVKTARGTSLKEWGVAFLILLVEAGALIWPNVKDFKTPVMGLGFSPSYVSEHNLQDPQYPTSLLMQLGIWGILITGLVLFVVPYITRKRRILNTHTEIFPAALALSGLAIIIGVDLVFVRDIYSVANPPYFRANTTFKFGYHAWVMLCIAFAAAISRLCLSDAAKPYKIAAGLLITIAVAGGAFYPYQAIKQFYLSNDNAVTLDGAAWMAQITPADFATVDYINHHVPERAVIAEAVGQSYSTHSRITTYSGMITPMGWQSHEWTWRFHVGEPGHPKETGWSTIADISGDIRKLYETADIAQAAEIIKRYHIDYVYVGALEAVDYPNLNAQKFNLLGHPVFSMFNRTLYKVSPDYVPDYTIQQNAAEEFLTLLQSPIGLESNCKKDSAENRHVLLTLPVADFVYMRAFGCPPSGGRFLFSPSLVK